MRTVRAVLVTILIILVALVAYSYVSGNASWRYPHAAQPGAIGTTGKVDVNVARERRAEVGEKLAVAAEKVKETAAEAALTSKIKAKMVLDDYVNARSIAVTAKQGTVTLRGVVHSVAEHDRALTIAHDTVGVTAVIDDLRVEKSST